MNTSTQMLNSELVNKISTMLNVIYASASTPEAIATANKYLTELISLSNLSLFTSLLTHSDLKLKFYASNSIALLIRENYVSFPKQTAQSIIEYITKVIFDVNVSKDNKFVIKNLISTLAIVIRLSMYDEQNLIMNYISNALINKNEITSMITSLDVLNELSAVFIDNSIPPVDKSNRIIAIYHSGIENLIFNFCIGILSQLLSANTNDNNVNSVLSLIVDIMNKMEQNDTKVKNAMDVCFIEGGVKQIAIDWERTVTVLKSLIVLYRDNKRNDFINVIYIVSKVILEHKSESIEMILKEISTIISVDSNETTFKLVFLLSEALRRIKCNEEIIAMYYTTMLKISINAFSNINSVSVDKVIAVNKSICNIITYIKEDSYLVQYISTMIPIIDSILINCTLDSIVDAFTMNELIESFSSISASYYTTVLPLLLSSLHSNQIVVLFHMEIAMKIFTKITFDSSTQVIIDSVIVLFRLVSSFQYTNESSLLNMRKTTLHFVSVFLYPLCCNLNTNLLISALNFKNSTHVITSVIDIVVSLLISSGNSYGMLVSSCENIFKLLSRKIFVNVSQKGKIMTIAKCEIDLQQMLQFLNEIILKLITFIEAFPSDDISIVRIMEVIFKIHLQVTHVSESSSVIKTFFESFTIPSLTKRSTFIIMLSLLKSFSLVQEYTEFIINFNIHYRDIISLNMNSYQNIRFVFKLLIMLTSLKQFIFIGMSEHINFADDFLENVANFIKRIDYSCHKDLVVKAIKLIGNISDIQKAFSIGYQEEKNKIYINVWNFLNDVIEMNFSVDELIGYNKKIRKIYNVINLLFNYKGSYEIKFSEKVCRFIYENVDSLDNLVMISTFNSIEIILRSFIEKRTKFALTFFAVYKQIMIELMIKIFTILSKGEINQLRAKALNLFFLISIFEEEFNAFINSNEKFKSNIALLFNGITSKDEVMLGKFIENLKEFIKKIVSN